MGNIDDQHRNPNIMNNKDHIVGQLTTCINYFHASPYFAFWFAFLLSLPLLFPEPLIKKLNWAVRFSGVAVLEFAVCPLWSFFSFFYKKEINLENISMINIYFGSFTILKV